MIIVIGKKTTASIFSGNSASLTISQNPPIAPTKIVIKSQTITIIISPAILKGKTTIIIRREAKILSNIGIKQRQIFSLPSQKSVMY